MKKMFLTGTGGMGFLLFAALFALTFGVPEYIEEAGKTFVKQQIAKKVKGKFEAIEQHEVAQKAKQWIKKVGRDEAQLKQNIEDKLHERIAQTLASLCGYDCEKKKAKAQSIKAGWQEKLTNLQGGQAVLAQLVKDQYVEVVENLRLDVRIFLGANAFLFSLLFLVSLLKPSAVNHLFAPALLLLVATVVASSIYIFGQNWFYTIIYNDYMGMAYLVYVGVIFGFLMDIVFNAGQVTTTILNAILEALGSAFSLSPC